MTVVPVVTRSHMSEIVAAGSKVSDTDLCLGGPGHVAVRLLYAVMRGRARVRTTGICRK